MNLPPKKSFSGRHVVAELGAGRAEGGCGRGAALRDLPMQQIQRTGVGASA